MVHSGTRGTPEGLLIGGLLFLGFAVKGLVTGVSWSPYGRVSEKRMDSKRYWEAIGMEILIGVGFVIYYICENTRR